MRLATYNVENLFRRPAAMNMATWADGKPVLDDLRKLNDLINRDTYTASVKSQILATMGQYPGLVNNGSSKFLRLREIRDKLVRRRAAGPQIEVNGRDEWVGWFELVDEGLDETAILNTGRILGLVNADVQCLMEVEDRIALRRFNSNVLTDVGATPFDHAMLIDGNDERGIDVALLHRDPFVLKSIVSHSEDLDPAGNAIFSRDCAEYELQTPAGNTLLLLVNHFKSKLPPASASNAKRLKQATRVREIYDQRRAEGFQHIAILGDFNDTPDSAPLDPLLQPASGLVDIMQHANFTGDGRGGTFANGAPSQKIDYILLSPALAALVTAGGVERRGVWGGANGTLFPHIPEITKSAEAASDHAALWADLNI
jgi:endonuclease/exonuclease/phosphatase family metal-dependent hydrolase